MPRGGKRPGAGAKPGNLNALKDGRHSPRFRQLLLALLALPEFRTLLLMAHRRQVAQDHSIRRTLIALVPSLADFIPPSAAVTAASLRNSINHYLASPPAKPENPHNSPKTVKDPS